MTIQLQQRHKDALKKAALEKLLATMLRYDISVEDIQRATSVAVTSTDFYIKSNKARQAKLEQRRNAQADIVVPEPEVETRTAKLKKNWSRKDGV